MVNERLKKIVDNATAILLDIEGTIASIDFIRNDALAYVEHNIEKYVMKNWEEVKETLFEIQKQPRHYSNKITPDVQLPLVRLCENEEDRQKNQRAVITYVKHQMKNNPSDLAMKEIQGLALQNALKDGILVSHIYQDAVKALKVWAKEGKLVYTYSTATRATQVEYLRRTMLGDMTEFIKGYFDTTIGSKLEPKSFQFICEFDDVIPREIVFFSDRPKEILAARDFGLRAILVDRGSPFSFIYEEQEFLGHEDGTISSFDELFTEA